MKVGILGSGDVGKALQKGFAGIGDDAKIGSREGKPGTVTFKQAAQHGELIVLAVRWDVAKSAIDLAGVESFKGKLVIDATNPLKQTPSGPALALGHTDSAGEQVQRWLPDAKVVKAFNIVGNAEMVNPQFSDGPPTMFIAGNDAAAKKTVVELLKKFGWPTTVDVGNIDGARLLEPLCILWVKFGVATGGWRHAFKMLAK
jgi:predicted dinucleotide-binding enzyme